MIIRVRSRDGLERVSVPDGPQCTVGALLAEIRRQLGFNPSDAILLSRNQNVLLEKEEALGQPQYADMADTSAPLAVLGLRHGDVVFARYNVARQVAGPAVSVVPAGSFGKKMTVEDLVLRQMRIERQEESHCQLLSFDRNAANQFQSYVNETLGFTVQRAGIMYGHADEGGQVFVDFIYEPPQTGTEHNIMLHRNPGEERAVDAIAAGLGMLRVGVIIAQSVAQGDVRAQAAEDEEHSYTLSAAEVRLAAELHAEALGLERHSEPPPPEAPAHRTRKSAEASAGPPPADSAQDRSGDGGGSGEGRGDAGGSGGRRDGEKNNPFLQFAVAIVKLEANEEGGMDVHFEAFQLSDQCVRLFADGWFAEPGEVVPAAAAGKAGSGGKGAAGTAGASAAAGAAAAEEGEDARVTRMRREVIVSRKETFEVDNDFFLLPIKIGDHEGPLGCLFPIENRLITPTEADLRKHLERARAAKQPYWQRLADFHLLLFLSRVLDAGSDLPVLAHTVKVQGPVPEGYQLIIESF